MRYKFDKLELDLSSFHILPHNSCLEILFGDSHKYILFSYILVLNMGECES